MTNKGQMIGAALAKAVKAATGITSASRSFWLSTGFTRPKFIFTIRRKV